MSKLAILNDLLALYKQLGYHQNPQLRQRLHDVQAWQKKRIQRTHAQKFNEKQNILMAEYFMNRLYGGQDFDHLAQQIERLIPKIHKAEKLIPENAIKTGTAGMQLAILAVQLDEQIAMQLLHDYPHLLPLNDELMRLTYLKLNQGTSRMEQLRQLDILGESLDKYLRSLVVHTAFKMCKSTAYKHRFNIMYDFMQDGFNAIKPLKSAENFIRDFTEQERQIITKVHLGDLTPFA